MRHPPESERQFWIGRNTRLKLLVYPRRASEVPPLHYRILGGWMTARRPLSMWHGPHRKSADPPDARQSGGRAAARRRMDLRTKVGWFSHVDLSRRRRAVHPESRREATRPLLPRARRPAQGAAADALRARRGNRDRVRRRPRFRGPAAAIAPGRVARENTRWSNAGLGRVLRRALRERSRSARC